jgi:hypothetical protein
MCSSISVKKLIAELFFGSRELVFIIIL